MHIICLGDSNTWGYDPRSYFGDRYPKESRWVDILAEKTGWNVQNMGMNGMEIPTYPINLPREMDRILIMLGTNDILQGRTAEAVAEKMARFLQMLSLPKEKILLIAPPQLQRGEWVPDHTLIEESGKLAQQYRVLASIMGIAFADSTQWKIPLAYDGVHFTETGHVIFTCKMLDLFK